MGITTILWFVFLFSMCFGVSAGVVGNPATYFFFQNVDINGPLMREGEIVVDGIPGLLFAAYQGMFAVITPALMTGAFADRFRFRPYVIFIIIWMVFVYAPFCHWVWGGGWMAEWGVWDFAGGIVVHITAGFSALASLVVVGKRQIPEESTAEDMDVPHNVPFVALGTAMLWFGWFGFNGGSALASGPVAVLAAVNSEIAGSVALFSWMCIDWFRNGKPSLVGACVGAIAGLATVTPAAGFIQPWAAFVLGLCGCLGCYACCEVRRKLKFDDALDVWGVHGMGGFLGTVLLGVLADGDECATASVEASGTTLAYTAPMHCANPGTITRSGEQFGIQLAAALMCAVYSFVVTLLILKLIDVVLPIVHSHTHQQHLDDACHGESAYVHSPTKAYAAEGTSPKKTEAIPDKSNDETLVNV